MNNFPLLSICVLTFNRKAHIVRILEFLKDEYQSLENKDVIEIIISDNNSTDGTDNFIREFINKNKLRKWIYNKNTKNTGLLGNLLKSEELATGKYLWWWGDDDHYKKGIIKAVMNHIKKNPDYIFLNHCASRQNAWDGLAFKNALENLGLSKNPTIMDIIKKSPGTIMFISASIYNRVRLNTLHSKEYKKNISLPLLYSLFCSARGNYIIDKNIWIDDNFKEISWSDQLYQVHYYYVPYYVSLMPELGYDKIESQEIYRNLYHDLWKRRLRSKIIVFLNQINLLHSLRKIVSVHWRSLVDTSKKH